MRYFLVLTLFFFLANKGTAQTQRFGVGGSPIAYICGTDAGTGNIEFYTTNDIGVGITYQVYKTHNKDKSLIFSGSGGSNFSFRQSVNYEFLDIIDISIISSAGNLQSQIRVNRLDLPSAPTLSTTNTLLCNGTSTTLTVTKSLDGTINWPSGAVVTSAKSATISSAGSYAISETNKCGTSEPSNTIVITTGSTPSAPTASASSTLLCDGANAILTATGSGGTYNWSNATTGATTTVNTAGSYYVTETNTCGTSEPSNNITITTSTTPIVAPITGTTTICPNATTQLQNATVGGIWSTLDATKATINTTGLVTGVATGEATIKYSITNTCGVGIAEKNITISSGAPAIPTITSPKTLLCNGESVILTSTAPGNGGIIIWSNGDNGTTTSVTTAGNYKVYEINSCGQSDYSNIIKITTLSNPNVAAITGNTDVCVGSQLILSNVTSGGIWSISESSKATINTTGVVTGVASGNITINYALSNTCGITTVSKIVKVNALPIINAIGGLSNICTNAVYSYTNDQSGGIWSVSNASVSSVNTSGQVTTKSFGTSTLTYTYTDLNACTNSVSKSLTINALPIVNISSSIVGSNVELTGTGATLYSWSSGETTANIQKAVSISNIYAVTGTDGNGCQSLKSFTVDAAPNASTTDITSSLGNIFCTSSETKLTLSAGNGYYWSNGANTRSINTSTVGTFTGYVLYSVNYKIEAAKIVLTNYDIPTVTAINNTNSLAYCNGVAVPTLTFKGPVNGTTYTWTNSNTTIGALTSGSNSISSFTASNTTNIPTVANFSVVPTANVCVGTTYNFTITINPTPNLLSVKNYEICNKTSNPITLTSNVNNATFLWTRDAISSIQNATLSGTTDIINETLNNTSKDKTTAIYSVVTSANGCSTTNTISVLVKPTVSVDQLNTLAYCNGQQPGTLTFTGFANNSTYAWTNDNTTIGALASGTNSIPNYVATNLGGDAVQANIAVVPTANGCTGPTMTFKIIVNPTPNLLTSKKYEVCNQTDNQIALTSNVNYATFLWTRDAISSIQNATLSGTTDIINETLNNTSKDKTTAIYSVVTSANGCSTTNTISVLVKPTVKVDKISDITYCNGTTAQTLTFTGYANNSTYAWTNDNKAIGISLSGTNSITSYTASNTTGDVVQSNIAVIPTANGCTGETMNFKIIVNPTPNLLTTKKYEVCNQTDNQIALTSNVNYATFLWTRDAISSIQNATLSGTTDIINETLNNTSKDKTTAIYSVVTSANGCSTTNTISVLVRPTVKVDKISDITYCNGTTAPTLTFTGYANNSTYAWTNDNKAIGISLSGTNSITSYTASNTTGDVVQSNIAVIPTANGCTGETMNFKIIVNPTPKLTSLKMINICDEGILEYNPKSNVINKYEVLWAVKKEDSTSIENSPIKDAFTTKLRNTGNLTKKVQFIGTLSSIGCENIDTLAVMVIPKPYGTLVAANDSILSGKMNTFRFVTTDTISRLNTWDLGFNMPKFNSKKDAYDMDYYYNKDTTNLISIMPVNRYGCFNVFTKIIYIKGVPTVVPNYNSIPTIKDINNTYETIFYPAPFKDWIKLRYYLKQSEDAVITVRDLAGAIIINYKVRLEAGNNNLDITELFRIKPEKLYTINVKSNSIGHQQLISRLIY